ncbi:hypothetical protein [Bradyrhizobium yuanmingense]|uniref:hypothetical protein n=1 Tax=Bradyrhizobium yuanmingense TaxID=108015 RepID=UPI0023EBDC1F|nr:hypothetical protein [Bradyrhizobium yuanmingense]MCA1526329.1 hypothetical protein [Bradyrhizobium yuanmingense]
MRRCAAPDVPPSPVAAAWLAARRDAPWLAEPPDVPWLAEPPDVPWLAERPDVPWLAVLLAVRLDEP